MRNTIAVMVRGMCMCGVGAHTSVIVSEGGIRIVGVDGLVEDFGEGGSQLFGASVPGLERWREKYSM